MDSEKQQQRNQIHRYTEHRLGVACGGGWGVGDTGGSDQRYKLPVIKEVLLMSRTARDKLAVLYCIFESCGEYIEIHSWCYAPETNRMLYDKDISIKKRH